MKRFQIEVNTLDGKLSYDRETAADALLVAEGAKLSLGVKMIDSQDGRSYTVEEFRKRFGN